MTSPGISTVNVANSWLNCIRASGTTRTVVSGTQVKLHTADPGSAGTANYSAGSGSAVTMTQNAASSGSIAISNAPAWTNGGTSETITDISVWDSGTWLYNVHLSSSQAWVSGNTFTLNSCSVALAPLA